MRGKYCNWTPSLLDPSPNSLIFGLKPSELTFKKLERRFYDQDQVVVVHAAVGASDGVSTLWTNEPGSGIASRTERDLDNFNIKFSIAKS